MALTKQKLCFDPANPTKGDKVGTYLLDPATGNPINTDNGNLSVDIASSSGTLDVNVTNASIEVTATDLDIRNLSSLQDNIAIRDANGDELGVNADGSINVNISDTSPIKFLASGGAVTTVQEDSAPLPVKLQGLTGDLNITAGDLNVQLDHSGANFDSVRLGDGTQLAQITANNDLQVVDRADTSILVTKVAVGTTSGNLLASNLAERKHVFIQNAEDDADIEIGQAGFTPGDGFIIPCGNTLDMRLGNVTVEARSLSGAAADVRVLELA